jgi:hypothetical protein
MAHAFRRAVQPDLHGVDYGLMLPAFDPALLAGRALGFQRTLGAVAVQGHSLLRRREAPGIPIVNSVPLAQSRESGDAPAHEGYAQTDLVGGHRALPIRIDQPCTQDLRPNASQDTVQPKQRSFEKRGQICRSGSVAKGTPPAHRFSRHPAE